MKGFVTLHNFLPVEQACFKIKIMPNTRKYKFLVYNLYTFEVFKYWKEKVESII